MKSKSPLRRASAAAQTSKLVELFTLSIEDALAGDVLLMRTYIESAATIINQGKPLPPKLRAVIVQGLRALASGRDVEAAFHLKVGHNRKRTRLRALRITHGVQQMIDQGISAPEAFEMMSRWTEDHELNRLIGPVVGADAIKKIYTKYRVLITEPSAPKRGK